MIINTSFDNNVNKENDTFNKLNTYKRKSERKRCVFINTYYKVFIQRFYDENPNLYNLPYESQKKILINQCFGDSDFYSTALTKTGWDCYDLIINIPDLQNSWAKENNFNGNFLEIAIEQIRQLNPDILFVQDIAPWKKELFDIVRPYAKIIVGQTASPVPVETYVKGFDILISSFPHYVERSRNHGITAYYQPLAFDPRVLNIIGFQEKKYLVTFIGSVSSMHSNATNLLETLSQSVPIDIWGYGGDSLNRNSPILKRHHGEAFGLKMFTLMAQSLITINRHIDAAENYANNMRLFEATGCGAMVITDYKDNLNDLFEIGKEIIAYRSPQECLEMVKYYCNNHNEALEIAKAGQARTIKDHNFDLRMKNYDEILSRHLRYKNESHLYQVPEIVSNGYELINPSNIAKNLTNAWKDSNIPLRQRGLVQYELELMYKGKTPDLYKSIARALYPYIYPGCSILEIGCSSGYYYEIIQYLLNTTINYTGVDYSETFIDMAKDFYPNACFKTADGDNLPFENESFYISISSCILLHVTNYKDHIRETARVAKKYVIAHRTPVHKIRPTIYYKKKAYGIFTVEINFNEKEFISEVISNNLKLIDIITINADEKNDLYDVTYVFEKL